MKRFTHFLTAMLLFGVMLFMHGCTKEVVRSLKVDDDQLEFAAVGSESQKVTVTAQNVEWKAAVEATATEWLKISVEGDVITVRVEDNDLEEDKVGKVVITDLGGYVSDAIITVTLKKLSYEATMSNFTFVAGDYYGDDTDDGIGKYTAVLSLNYDLNVVTKASELHTKDVLYLTFFSEVSLDAEYAMPGAGRYEVASQRGLSSVLAGKSKTGDNEYDGSYVVSTIDEVAQESKITGGYMEISYLNGKCVFSFELEDEKGIFTKYADMEFKYTGNGEESFENKAIEYHIFKNPENDYIRCWYWGEPLNSVRESVDGYPLGEYNYVFSNATDGDLVADGQVSTNFNLMHEYQLYGLDCVMVPGVYPVNQESFRGVLGTIFKDDLTHSLAPNRGTAMVKLFEDGAAVRYFVEDGWFAIFADENGVIDRYIVHFVLENGEVFDGRYDGEVPVVDKWTFSKFREDITQDNLTSAFMRIKDPDYWYTQAGSNHWELYLMGEGVSVSFDEYGYSTIKGPGDCFVFEISTEASATEALPAGTYDIKDSYEPWVAQYGDKIIADLGIYMGAWFHRLSRTEDPLSTMGLSGTVTISESGGEYTIETTFTDDAKNTISGKYTGVPTIEDHRTPSGSAPYQFKGYDYKGAADSSAEYRNAVKERTEKARARLK